MDRLADLRKDTKHDPHFWEPMRELRDLVNDAPWYPMDVNSGGRIVKVLGKGKTLTYDDGWQVQYCIYDQGQTVKKVIQIAVKGHLWTDVPREFRHARANVILDVFFDPQNDIGECAILPDGGIQFAQDEPHWSMSMGKEGLS